MDLKNSFAVYALIFLMTLAGCDQIRSLFSGKKEVKAPAQSAAVDPNTPLPANVLARVGTWNLTVDEFKERLDNLKKVLPEFNMDDRESKKLILDELVRQRLLVQEAERQGVANKNEI